MMWTPVKRTREGNRSGLTEPDLDADQSHSQPRGGSQSKDCPLEESYTEQRWPGPSVPAVLRHWLGCPGRPWAWLKGYGRSQRTVVGGSQPTALLMAE